MLVEEYTFGKVADLLLEKNELGYRYLLTDFSTFYEDLLQSRPQRKKQQFWNLMYIMILKAYCSSFSPVTACTFVWVTDGRSLIKTKSDRLINSVFFRVQLISKKVKRGKYCVKVQYMVHESNKENIV